MQATRHSASVKSPGLAATCVRGRESCSYPRRSILGVREQLTVGRQAGRVAALTSVRKRANLSGGRQITVPSEVISAPAARHTRSMVAGLGWAGLCAWGDGPAPHHTNTNRTHARLPLTGSLSLSLANTNHQDCGAAGTDLGFRIKDVSDLLHGCVGVVGACLGGPGRPSWASSVSRWGVGASARRVARAGVHTHSRTRRAGGRADARLPQGAAEAAAASAWPAPSC
jgi:hypothetical protein